MAVEDIINESAGSRGGETARERSPATSGAAASSNGIDEQTEERFMPAYVRHEEVASNPHVKLDEDRVMKLMSVASTASSFL